MGSIWSYVYELLIKYSYIGLYLGLAIEGTGMPGPVELFFLAAAYFIHIHRMSMIYTVITATLGNLSGNLLAYLAGYYGGRPIVEKLNRYLHIKDGDFEKLQGWFNKYGGLTNMISRWIGITRTPAIWAAGIMRINILSYTVFSFIGDLVWVIFWILLCVYAYINIEWLLNLPVEYKLIAVTLASILIYFAWRIFFKYLRREDT
ncbi:MAG: DedA family protein [Thermoanaerobacteraceae bacterium]|nr:DedA family protein [Thermoanaerobacteraceae bacterium]